LKPFCYHSRACVFSPHTLMIRTVVLFDNHVSHLRE
jgi:hypothetical protein